MKLHLDPPPDGSTSSRSSGRDSRGSACPRRSGCVTARPHFQHIFSGGYSAAYYSYLWSEVLDADGFEAFEEAGDIFDPDVAKRLHDYVYAAGGSRDYDEAYRGFRGRSPSPDALFRKRGLELEAGRN